jgi:outer membrane immunogenic protein
MSQRTLAKATAAVLLAATSLAALPATAADLGGGPARPPRDFSPPYYAPQSNLERWTGFYVGGTLGYSFGDARVKGDVGNFPYEQDGLTGTVFAGYNWQIGRSVLGLEADVGTGSLGSSKATPFGTLETELSAMGSFRGRAGFLLTPALLLYGTAGFAWANMDIGYAGLTQRSETFFGYQLGLGSELQVSRSVGLRLEYIYTDLERERVSHSGQFNTYHPDFRTVRAGVSFKF